MGKKNSGIHGWTWALCLGVLVGGASAAQEAGPVYIQGSEVNLRKGANTSAEVVQKVLIGTACQRQGEVDKKGWVQLRCGDAEGYTLDKLVGAEKPSLESLMVQAQDPAKSTKERLDAAARAATLAPEDEPASRLLASLFFDVNFEQLDKDKRKGGLHESFLVTCNEELRRQRRQPSRTHEQCLTDELEKTEYDWHQLSIREERFVSAMFQEGALVVYTGYLKPRARGRFNPKDDEFDIIIESRSRSPVADVLKAALQREARAPNPETRKYYLHSVFSEYKNLPVLPPTAYKLFRSLPAVWYLLSEQSGERFIHVNCGSITAMVLHLDVHRRASIYRGLIPMDDDESYIIYTLKDVSKTATGYQLQLCRDQDCDTSKAVTWPTPAPGVARWVTQSSPDPDGKSDVLDEYFSIKKGKPNRVEYSSCGSGGE